MSELVIAMAKVGGPVKEGRKNVKGLKQSWKLRETLP
jgi:hypothetical protein